jgi:suppressor of G2 allele of SKP1
MAIERLIQQGDAALKQGDFLEVISKFSAALKENPKSFNALIKRSIGYQKLSNYEAAMKDISDAFSVAQDKGKRSEMGLCYFRLALIYFIQKRFKIAHSNIVKAKEFDCQEKTVDLWISKIEYELKKNPSQEDDEIDDDFPIIDADIDADPKLTTVPEQKLEPKTVSEAATAPINTTQPSTSIDVINKQAPLKIKIREDWYQSNYEVIITIYAKNVKEEELKVTFETKAVNVTFPNGANSEYNYTLDPLYGDIDTEKSRYKVYSTKLEVVLIKMEAHKWPTLERSGEQTVVVKDDPTESSSSGLVYPTSSKKAINWAKFKVDEEDDKSDDPNAFFAQLFKDTDDDSRRAMMKSYTESNGTILTTSWDEAKKKHFETTPPEGMEAHKWAV